MPAQGQGGRRIAQSRSRQALADSLGRETGCTVISLPAAGTNELAAALEGTPVIFSAGAAGVTLLPASIWRSLPALELLIDLNAVPPAGIEGVEAHR